MSFLPAFEKTALFGWLKEKKKAEPKITPAHEKYLLPSFRAHDKARKNYKPGAYANEHDLAFSNRVAELEHKSGIPNEKLYSHMYERYGFDRKKK